MSAYLLSFLDIETTLFPLFISPFMELNGKYVEQEQLPVLICVLRGCVGINTFMFLIVWLSLFTDAHITY